MNPKDLNENQNLLLMIDKIMKENPGTNFQRCFPDHFTTFIKYMDSARKKEMGCFPDRDAYQAFAAAKLFFDKLKFVVFQKEDETQDIEDKEAACLPPLDAFHHTEDEIEMKKNRILKGLNKGDVLHLKVVEEDDKHYNLQILDKYDDKQRIIDCSLFAQLIKSNPLVQDIKPPLKVDDLVRAVAFGNLKQEQGKYRKLIVSLNSNFVSDKLKSLHLHLGRVYKKDIPYYPEDVGKFQSFGEYLKSKTKFQSPEMILKEMRSFGCDPLKTGPLYETRYKKQISTDYDTLLSEATQKLSITGDQTRKADELLRKGDLLNALIEIEQALLSYADNDLALTIRGKIYLALAGGMPSCNVKKAFLDFERALKLNRFNVEASEFREAILVQSWESFTKKNMPEKAKKIQDVLGKQSISVATEAFLKNIKNKKGAANKASSGASSSRPIPVVKPKEEPMDV